MAIGSSASVISANAISAALVQVLGTSDLHSHFRAKPLLAWARRQRRGAFKTIVEIGCGGGANIFALAGIMGKDINFVGFDLSPSSVKMATTVAEKCNVQNAMFYCQDCSRFGFGGKPDVILLMDFLEHIADPVAFLRDLRGIVDSGTVLLISVPTPRYPKIFGKEFHNKVGHLIDGYDILSLSAVLNKAGFAISTYQYNTGMIASILCYAYYNALFRFTGKLKSLMGLCLGLFRWADFWVSPRASCSLFAVGVVSEAAKGSPSDLAQIGGR
jgi:SAM-dependent methyltransferase